jgi:hypothetical protein
VSNCDSLPRRDAAAAARKRAIFCCGVSFEGAEPKSIREPVGTAPAKVGGPLGEDMCGAVAVKRVASCGVRGIGQMSEVEAGFLVLLPAVHGCRG